jgi:hypothetical protein
MTIWSDERAAEIKKVWDTKDHSAAEIGRMFGVSRNVIIGLAHRRKWAARDECKANGFFAARVPKPKADKPKRQPATFLPYVVDPMPLNDAPAPAGGVPFMLTTARQCRFCIESEAKPAHAMMMVCGGITEEGRPYCAEHLKVVSGHQPRRVKPPYESTVVRRTV